eukprot:CAMPEP_0172593992 /NCGR_PEP_ID=MMETSP1068-20121228/13244_1 /TAXON_ID=35684 /ORGANISM="Pseudopedinella elastica, Strain CCMP716" /LENGTH=64 /DNA_ID=CAMNT_0013391739 /DNA_START=73 /DNA_END=267 /DNA_ORIENTATION=-
MSFLTRCLSIPHCCLLVALEHALAFLVHHAMVILRRDMSLVGSDFPTPNGRVYLAGLGGRQPAP